MTNRIEYSVIQEYSRKLGIGELVQWGDFITVPGDAFVYAVNDRQDGYRITEDTQEIYYRMLNAPTNHRPLVDTMPEAPSEALTYDEGKAPLACVPWAAVREMVMVQLYGAKKYGDWNNYKKGMQVTRNLSCAIRHLAEFMEGQDLDTESGRNHLGHALCRIAFVVQNFADGVARDDRFKKS